MVLTKLDGIDSSMPSTNTYLLPLSYMAPIEYYAYLCQYNCQIEVHEHFIKQSIRNRATIYGSNGALNLTVPKVRKSSSKTSLKDLKISHEFNWAKEHWQSLMSAYRSSPFFEYFEEDFFSFYQKKFNFLFDLNVELHLLICSKIGISQDLNFTTTYNSSTDCIDLRNYNFNKEELPRYIQVFENKYGFLPNLSILDLLFNEGKNAKTYLEKINI